MIYQAVYHIKLEEKTTFFSIYGNLVPRRYYCFKHRFPPGRVLNSQQIWRPPLVDHVSSIYYILPRIIWNSGCR